ncbi:M3 family metallopeptidase [Microbacterium telephonicum]|uniref:Thimet oligopeptidase n=1 Tax=Microbacterium telephonicum TaxID=1714841 RepID=A0A498C6B7_9MICO|nr:M3 family metallopeptidase [Microbacterium telephonicum]RLK48078.1 thimet oligopeptidase [Microbacterium telephonicum]
MTAPEPVAFPSAPADWPVFLADTRARLDTVRELDARLRDGAARTTAEKLALWDAAETELTRVGSVASVLSEAHPDAAVREAAEAIVQAGSELAAERTADPSLWAAFAQAASDDLDPLAARYLSVVQRDFRRGGVDLPECDRDRARALADRDTTLSLAFSRNIREGRREIRVAPAALAGLPQDFVDAHPVGADGLVALSTDYPDLMPVREYATDRATRAALVGAYNDLAWPVNDAVLAELLEVRAERAALLGFTDWADYEADTRMIGSGAAIAAFLERLDDASREAADTEYPILLDRLRQDDPDAGAVTIADFFHLLGVLKRERHDVDAQLVRSYFTFDRVRQGLLDTTARLLDIAYVPVDAPAWHPDVASYDVVRGGRTLGRIHLDLHPREGKYSHAACFPVAPGLRGRGMAEAALLCNFSRGAMEHDEVVTFFHEFGHLVHFILGGDQEWVRFTGFETEWDFVEAPSQLLEEWAWDPDVLATFTAGADGAPIPRELVERMKVADAFGRALEVRRQLGHASVSYRLHVDRPADLQAATERLYAQTSPVQPLPGRHPYAGFGHLTGYGACYYTYQWSLVIARDLLSAWHGDLSDAEVAARYRTEILERGGSRDAVDLVAAFLGREGSFDAYREWLSVAS